MSYFDDRHGPCLSAGCCHRFSAGYQRLLVYYAVILVTLLLALGLV
ncbi:MAG: hypothetical protein ACR5LF_00955 [Symbiopectobacterium sp.]